jgi:upstream activation factor subunit UAF30
MTEATKKPAAKAAAKPKAASTKDAATKSAAPKEAASKTKGAAAKEKGTSTKGPTKSAPGSATKPKAKPAQQPPSAFSKPLTPSKELAAVVGDEPLPRTVAVSKIWEYIKEHKLQNEKNKREILADAKLKAVFGKDKATMFEMNKFLAAHLKG